MRRLDSDREEIERQVPAGRDDEEVILDKSPPMVSLCPRAVQTLCLREAQEVELVGLLDEEAEVWETVKMRAGRAGRVKGVAWENSAVLWVMRRNYPEDARTLWECVFSQRATVVQLSGSVSAGPVGLERSSS